VTATTPRRLDRLACLHAVLLLVIAGCGGPPGSGASPRGGPTATPRVSPTPPAPTAAPTPLPLPAIDLSAPQVWYGPNMGSVDFPELFTSPERWSAARERVDVFQFYGNAVSGDPFDIGGDNVLDTFVDVDAFGQLHEWGIAIALEMGVIKWFACGHASWAEYANRGITNVEANGGRVSFVAMDEPLLGGQISEGGVGCDYSVEEAAAEVAAFMTAVTAEHPDVRIGTIETIPPHTVGEIEEWMLALEAAGAKPAFLHLDVEIADGIANPVFVAELRQLRDFSEDRGIPFGLILTADWQVADSHQAYYESVMQWTHTIRLGMGRPSHLIFQSWMGPAANGFHEMPVNLPEDEPGVYSHTRLILDGLGTLEAEAGS